MAEQEVQFFGMVVPLDVPGGPTRILDTAFENATTDGRPSVCVGLEGTFSIVFGNEAVTLDGCSSTWFRELALALNETATLMEHRGGNA